jgi:hypothetical protein
MTTHTLPVARTLALAALLACAPAALRAQTLRGTVTDRATRGPGSGATVVLIGPDSQKVASAISGDDGRFSVTTAAGEYMVAVERLGYGPITDGPIRLRMNGFAEVTLGLMPQAIALDSLGVSVDQQDPALLRAGFYKRKKDSHGIFLDRTYIEKRSTQSMSDILSGLQGVRVLNQNGSTDVQLRSAMTNVFRGTPQMCLPLVYVDGLLMADGKVAGGSRMNLELLRPNDLAGIEVYTSQAAAPMEYSNGGGQCGVLVFWTRSGQRRK